MKQLAPLLFVFGLALSGRGAEAQRRMPAGKAQVYTVASGGTAARFEVPQVRLSDAAVARQINTSIVNQVLESVGLPAASAVNARQALRIAQRACCTDEETGLPSPGQGLTGCTYQVLHLDGQLLCLEFNLEFTGAYTWGTLRHAVFNLTTGKKLALTDIVADSPSYLRRTLRRAINQRVAQTLDEILKSEGDTTVVADLAERFNWHPLTRQVVFREPGLPGFENFSVTDRGISVFYSPWLPPSLWPYLPEPNYFFPFTKLKLTDHWRYLSG